MNRFFQGSIILVPVVVLYTYIIVAIPTKAQDLQDNTSHRYDLIDNGNGTITDSKTGLMWLRDDSTRRMSIGMGETYASDLEVAGHKDWRLPTSDELLGLYKSLQPESEAKDDRRIEPFRWSGSQYMSKDRSFLLCKVFDFEKGSVITHQSGHIRAVRSATTAASQTAISNRAEPSRSPDTKRKGTFLWGIFRGVVFPVIAVKIGISSLVHPQEGRDAFSLIWDSFWTESSNAHRAGIVIGAILFVTIIGPMIARRIT